MVRLPRCLAVGGVRKVQVFVDPLRTKPPSRDHRPLFFSFSPVPVISAAAIAGLLFACKVALPTPEFQKTALDLGAHARDGRCQGSESSIANAILATEAGSDEKGGAVFGKVAASRSAFACLALRDNFERDSRGFCMPDASIVFSAPLVRPLRVEGEVTYVGVDPREYAYDLVPRADFGVDVRVRIQFRGPSTSKAVMDTLQAKLNQAAALWTAHSPEGRIHFQFIATTNDSALPHFQVDLVPGRPRSPFDVTWGSDWSFHLMAHEIGHMMGLDDEYGQLRKTLGHILGRKEAWDRSDAVRLSWFRCDLGSLMCDSEGERSIPLPHHYYVLLRRRFCPNGPSSFAF